MSILKVLVLVAAAACAGGPKPVFDPEDAATWGPPALLVENQTGETVTVYGPGGVIGRVWPGESRCFRLHGQQTGSIWLTAELNASAWVRSLDFTPETEPGWRWTLTTAWRYDVHVIPAWPCHEEPEP